MIAEAIYSILLVVGLFMLGVISPGPNFFIVVETSLAAGRRAGTVTGLGVATGDAIYAAAGIFGLSSLITQTGWLFYAIKVAGGLYIAWIGVQMIRGSNENPDSACVTPGSTTMSSYFGMGLMTDLSNPKTVVFFASIFATVYRPDQPTWVSHGMLLGIVLSSVLWRIGLATIFSRRVIRGIYLRFRRGVERLFGGLLILFGLRLAIGAHSRS